MGEKQAGERIAALKAIIQTIIPEFYLTRGLEGARANFFESLESDDHIAMAIANEFSRAEIEEAFDWIQGSHRSVEAEMSATPITPYLTPEQATRVRAKLAEIDRVDETQEEATREPM